MVSPGHITIIEKVVSDKEIEMDFQISSQSWNALFQRSDQIQQIWNCPESVIITVQGAFVQILASP